MGVPGYVLDDPAEVPEDLEYLFAWHDEIRARAARNMSFDPILITEVEAYGRHLAKLGIEMDVFDEDLLWRIDNVWMSVTAEALKRD